MTKISADHSSRAAYIYVRQSTSDQLTNNPESRRRQYALADRARKLGWSNVIVIDDDLGRSGGGIARPGFERSLAAICTGTAGAVFAIEASRLARNGRDWHTLLESCPKSSTAACVGTTGLAVCITHPFHPLAGSRSSLSAAARTGAKTV
jgi:hypothetical protein